MDEQPQIGKPTGAGFVNVEKVVSPYRAVTLTLLLEKIGEVHVPFPPKDKPLPDLIAIQQWNDKQAASARH